MSKEMGIAGLILLIALGVVVWLYGDARFSAGKSSCVATQVVQGEAKKGEAVKNLEKVERETHFMSDTDVDADLFNLGIMRSESDY